MRRKTRLLVACLACSSWLAAHAAELPRLFSDGMVLQRDRPIPVWGRSAAGAQVRVSLADDAAQTRADAHGDWRVELPARPAGGPYAMRIDDGGPVRELRDVQVGDVWLASGQSNMAWPLVSSAGADAGIARATDALVRHFQVPRSWSGEPQWQLSGGEWVASSPETAGGFSAVAHFFARDLREATGVPIGIIESAWGGSRIEAWTDARTQGLKTADVAARMRGLEDAERRGLAEVRRNLSRFADLPADDRGWQAPDFDDAAWADIPVPSGWEAAGWNGMDGVAWYRTTFVLDAADAKAGVLLGVGRIDDSDVTWVNGVQVGETRMQYDAPRRYAVPGSALRAGVNHVAVRVTDDGGGGGIHGPGAEVFVQPEGGAPRTLDGAWKFRPARVTLAPAADWHRHPALLYNAMIHPLQPYPLRGVIWYQGESNADTVEEALRYRRQFPDMIRQWRAQRRSPALPFLWVQLAGFGSRKDSGQDSPWAVLRESQSSALSLPATAQAVAIDIGDAGDIHPRNKREVGRRLALAARHVAYGEAVPWSGPVATGTMFGDGAAVVRFDTGARTLAVRGDGDAVHGFQLAGADRVFHPATARIDGATLVVRSAAVEAPVAVRYAWRDDPSDADLINDAGLPASPFRSDDW